MLGKVFCAVILLLATSCSSWREVRRFDGWTLYGEKGAEIDVAAFRAAFDPAKRAVEERFGPFQRDVRVHALGPSEAGAHDAHETGIVQEVPGIGRARVRAYHARGNGLFGSSSGVYAGVAEPGTAVHELVHARIAEEAPDLPLWFEEGLACLLGDGFLDQERWVVDGLACWPLRELRDQKLGDADLRRLLALRAEDSASSRDNVLLHFVGWAIVFDLYRESGGFEWRDWAARRSISLAEARERLERTLSPETEQAWLLRLSDPDRGVRLATAKGLWKLRSENAVIALLDRLDEEKDPEVLVSLAINALAAAGETHLAWRVQGRMWDKVWPVLRRANLPDPVENDAMHDLSRSFRRRTDVDAHQALEGLRRFWAE